MSAVARHSDQAARRLTVQRVRAAGRSRRADAGTLTEMARELAGARGRLTSRPPLAVRRQVEHDTKSEADVESITAGSAALPA